MDFFNKSVFLVIFIYFRPFLPLRRRVGPNFDLFSHKMYFPSLFMSFFCGKSPFLVKLVDKTWFFSIKQYFCHFLLFSAYFKPLRGSVMGNIFICFTILRDIGPLSRRFLPYNVILATNICCQWIFFYITIYTLYSLL